MENLQRVATKYALFQETQETATLKKLSLKNALVTTPLLGGQGEYFYNVVFASQASNNRLA